jgi:hypothetical protein
MTKRSKRVDTAGRGKLVGGPGGVCGRLVGSLNGCRWVAWEQDRFAAMCRSFDALAK